MSNQTLSVQDGQLMIRAIERLKDFQLSEYSMGRASSLQNRIARGFPALTSGELKNICLGLELILEDNPLDWHASQLLTRLRSFLIENNIEPDTLP